MKKLLLIGSVISAFSTQAVLAEQPSFNYIEGGYSRFEFDGIDEEADGYMIRGSVELSDMVYLNGSYYDVTMDDATGNIFSNDDLNYQKIPWA